MSAVAAISTPINPKTSKHGDPLLPSEPDNALAPRTPKARQVTSRHMSRSTSTRCHSPLVSGTVNSTPPPQSPVKRSESMERRRPATPRAGNAQKMLFTSSRSLSVSFQGESLWIQVSKPKPAPSPSLRRKAATSTSASAMNVGYKAIAPHPELVAPRKSVLYSPVSSPRGGVINSRGQLSPIRFRPASPSTSSSSRGVSPSPIRNGVSGSLNDHTGLSNEPSILSFAVDVRRGRLGENRIVDAHLVRLLYNRLLQWRFANARADTYLSLQRLNAEKGLYDAWASTSKLRESVRAKRTELLLLKQHFKLISILKEQMIYLEDWTILDPVYSNSLSAAIEALKASTLRLPVVGGAKADVLKVKDAVCSAVNVMHAMASSMCLLLPKVGHVSSLVAGVANLSAKEHVSLDECKDVLSMVTAMQVRECSLRTHLSQLKPEAQQ